MAAVVTVGLAPQSAMADEENRDPWGAGGAITFGFGIRNAPLGFGGLELDIDPHHYLGLAGGDRTGWRRPVGR